MLMLKARKKQVIVLLSKILSKVIFWDRNSLLICFKITVKLTYLNAMLRNSVLLSYPGSQFTEPSFFGTLLATRAGLKQT